MIGAELGLDSGISDHAIIMLPIMKVRKSILHNFCVIQAFLGAILWRLIEALASEGLSFLPTP